MKEAGESPGGSRRREPRRAPAIDPLIVAAIADVDLSLVESALRLSPGERLDACYRTVMDLARFSHATPKNR